MHIITGENYAEANEAVRDVLMTYVELAFAYEGWGHLAHVHVRFDPLKFVDAESDGKAYYVDLALLNAGSAIAILCEYYDLWCEEQSLSNNPRTKLYWDAVKLGRLRSFPDIEAVIRQAVSRDTISLEDGWFEDAVVPIYRNYVTPFFARLAASDRYAT